MPNTGSFLPPGPNLAAWTYPSSNVSLRHVGRSRLSGSASLRPARHPPNEKRRRCDSGTERDRCRKTPRRASRGGRIGGVAKRLLEIDEHVADIAPTLPRVHVEAPLQQVDDARWNRRQEAPIGLSPVVSPSPERPVCP